MKSIFASKTFWLNVLGVGACVYNGPVGHYLSPDAAAGILGALNIATRFITHEPVSLFGHKP